MKKCYECGSNDVAELCADEELLYRGEVLNVPLEYSLCRNCGFEFVPQHQIISNDATVREYKGCAK